MGSMVLTGLTIASSVVSGVGQIAAGNAAAQSDLNAAAAADYNAQVAEQNAKRAEYQAKIEQSQNAADAYKAMGRQRAALAQNGILNSVTGDLLEDDSQREYEQDQAGIKYKYSVEQSDYLAQAQNYRMNAKTYRGNAKANRRGGFISAGGSLLGGASQAYQYSRLY